MAKPSSNKAVPSQWLKETPLGDGLRKAYKDVQAEPVPDRFKQMLDDMRAAEKNARGS